MKKNYFFGLLMALAMSSVNAQNVATFEELTLTEAGYWNGSNGDGGFTSGPATFNNNFNNQYASWSGFAYTNQTDNTTASYENQYAAITGAGVNGSRNYVTGYVYMADTIELTNPEIPLGMYVTNATWPGLVMRDGDAFSKKFGGETGNDPDWFKLTVNGFSADGNKTGTIDFYLADYRFDDNSKDYILTDWNWVDLTALGEVKYLTLGLSSTDVGDWGMNTPAYFCIDNFTTTTTVEQVTFNRLFLDEESYYNGADGKGGFGVQNAFFPNNYNLDWNTWSGWTYSNVSDNTTPGIDNQYSAFPGEGVNGSDIYAVSYSENELYLSGEGNILGVYVTNSTYAALSMQYGDDFSKKFGGEDGTDPDYFLLTITGFNNQDDSTGIKDVFLADYRSEDASKDYILDKWKWVDLSGFDDTRKLEFRLSSTDNGDWGMNTPAYFCLDGLTYNTLPEKEIVFTVNHAEAPIEGAQVDFLSTSLTTNMQGEAIFSAVSPTLEMPFSVSYNGYVDSIGNVNGFTTDEVMVNLLPNSLPSDKKLDISIYPNPAKDVVMINTDVLVNQVQVYTVAGIPVLNLYPVAKTVTLPIQRFAPGIYFVKVATDGGEYIKKIYKE